MFIDFPAEREENIRKEWDLREYHTLLERILVQKKDHISVVRGIRILGLRFWQNPKKHRTASLYLILSQSVIIYFFIVSSITIMIQINIHTHTNGSFVQPNRYKASNLCPCRGRSTWCSRCQRGSLDLFAGQRLSRSRSLCWCRRCSGLTNREDNHLKHRVMWWLRIGPIRWVSFAVIK